MLMMYHAWPHFQAKAIYIAVVQLTKALEPKRSVLVLFRDSYTLAKLAICYCILHFGH